MESEDYKWSLFGRSTGPPKGAVKIGKIVTPAFRLFSANRFSDSNKGLKIYWPSVTAMDRTKNLLDKISNMDTVRTAADMETLLDEVDRAIGAEDDDTQAFSRDPYVAAPAAGFDDSSLKKKKSIEEILETIHGYQICNDGADQQAVNEAVEVDATPRETPLGKATEELATENVAAVEVPAALEPSSNVAAVTEPVDSSLATGLPIAPVVSHIAIELELDVNNFCSPTASKTVRVVEQPAPIRCAFDWEPESSDVSSTIGKAGLLKNTFKIPSTLDSESMSLATNQPMISTLPSLLQPGHLSQSGHSPQSDEFLRSRHFLEKRDSPQADEPVACFLAQNGDTIFIDGNDGYGYIDLTNFDRSQASFQANEILLKCGDGTHFQIDYRNIPVAIFAGGEEVELAANEMVSRR